MKKVILIVIAIIVVGAAGYLAYVKFSGSSSESGGGLSSLVSKVSLNPNCKYKDSDLCKFINGWKEVKYYSVTSDSTDKDGKKSQFVFKSIGETKSQMLMTEAGKETYNIISIDKTTYTKDYTDNKWWKQTAASEDNAIKTEESSLDFDTKADAVEDKTTYKKIGMETVGKYNCFKYQVIDPAMTEGTEYIYFDNKEYQLRKTRDESSDGSVTESVVDYSKVSIDAPSPTKEGNPYSVTIPETTTTTTSTDSTTSLPTTTTTTTPSVDTTTVDPGTDTTTTDTPTIDTIPEIPTDSSLSE